MHIFLAGVYSRQILTSLEISNIFDFPLHCSDWGFVHISFVCAKRIQIYILKTCPSTFAFIFAHTTESSEKSYRAGEAKITYA